MSDDCVAAEHGQHWLLDALHTERRQRGASFGVAESEVRELRRWLWHRIDRGELAVTTAALMLLDQVVSWLTDPARRHSPSGRTARGGGRGSPASLPARSLALPRRVARDMLAPLAPWSLNEMPTSRCSRRSAAARSTDRPKQPETRRRADSAWYIQTTQRSSVASLAAEPTPPVTAGHTAGVYELPTLRVSFTHKIDVNRPAPVITGPADVEPFFRRGIGAADREYMFAALLDACDRLMGLSLVAIGSIVHINVRAADVYRPLILAGSVAYYLCHNHPSGDASPSEPDVKLTRWLHELGGLLGIELRDHLILGAHGTYVSLRAYGVGIPQWARRRPGGR